MLYSFMESLQNSDLVQYRILDTVVEQFWAFVAKILGLLNIHLSKTIKINQIYLQGNRLL
jgi:hypothetical protein